MSLTNLKIEDLFKAENKLTFLVGAGCSVDPPSCLPDGHKMMDAIIRYTCAETEIDKILELKELRFEGLVENTAAACAHTAYSVPVVSLV